MANQLVSDWMRPIIRRSKVFADKEVLQADEVDVDDMPAPRARKGAATPTAERERLGTNESIAKRHARIPEALTTSFKVAPPTEARDREMAHQGMNNHSVGVTTKMKTYKKKLIAGAFYLVSLSFHNVSGTELTLGLVCFFDELGQAASRRV